MNMTFRESNEELKTWITKLIQDFSKTPKNALQNKANEPAWEEPLVGFSQGDDPLYKEYKEYVGSYHWTPWEIFSKIFPNIKVEPNELTVICWVLPQTSETKIDNRKQTVYPAERWTRSRIYGETFNLSLRKYLAKVLNERGYEAVAPYLSFQWKIMNSEKYTYSSTWSERHAAYASGLGTFGLCDGLITPRGKAMRAGSVVARLRVLPTPRPYTHHRAYCLFFAKGICGKCITRCPVDAITKVGHDKKKCRDHLSKTKEYVRASYALEGYGCGLCQTGVPCESGIPVGI